MTNYTTDDVWDKAEIVNKACEAAGYRKDKEGAWIKESEYGNRDSKYGWEIDHITPVSNGGDDILSNVRPLHWRNNLGKSNGRLHPVVTSSDNKNVWYGTNTEFVPGDEPPDED